MMKKKIAFFYIDKTYTVYHTIGIAIELSKYNGIEVTAFCNKRSLKLVKEILTTKENSVEIVYVKPYWQFQVPVYVEIKIQLRNIIFRKYKKILSKFDVVVSSIYNDLEIKRIVSDKIKLIYTSHGVANRDYSFDDDVKKYDYVLLSGQLDFIKRKEKKQVSNKNAAVIGYPKLDVVLVNQKVIFFNNKNKTVLYNPHWDKRYSSYFTFGKTILSFFKNNPELNLIFAPHSLLKERYAKIYWDIRKYKNIPNILIDLGSEMANNMTYTKYANIYLGDYSSQALEFALLKRRPCIFIKPPDANNQEKAISWVMGEVCDNVSEEVLSPIIEKAEKLFPEKFKKEQDTLTNSLFTLPKSITSSQAAAESILKFAKTI